MVKTVSKNQLFIPQNSQGDAKALNLDNNLTRITDFPLELLLDIYEDLDLNQLANVAKTHPYNWAAADIVYVHKFSLQSFDVNGTTLFDGDFNDGSNHTHEFNSMLNSLEVFGHYITKIKIDYSLFNEEQSEMINQHINKYVANSLVGVEILQFDEKNLVGLGGLPNVKTVRLARGNATSDEIDFGKIFPALRSLDILCMCRKFANFERHFPKLEEISMEMFLETNLTKFAQRLQLNPQLRSLQLWTYRYDNLRMINELLPNLDRLDLGSIDTFTEYDDGGDIHFKNLKFLSIDSYLDYMERSPIIVSSLEEIKCFASTESCFNIIIQNKNLKKIQSVKFDDTQLQRIGEELPNLEEILIQHTIQNNEEIDRVIRFLETSKNLKKISFWNWSNGIEVTAAIHARLPNWSSFVEGIYLNFERT